MTLPDFFFTELDLGGLDQDLDQGWDKGDPLTWSSVKVRGYKSGSGPPTRSTMPNGVWNITKALDRTVHETKHAQSLAQSCGQIHQAMSQATCTQTGCHEAWLLLDHLHTEISIVHKALEDNEGNELSLAGYDRSATLSVCADVPKDEVWENVNPGLDRILGFRKPKGEIAAMIHGGHKGLQGSMSTLKSWSKRATLLEGCWRGRSQC